MRLNDRFFSNGWVFFLPYLLLYLAARIFRTPISILACFFWVIHLTVLVLLVIHLLDKLKKRFLFDWLFWMALFLFFWIPGAYLEYPADPWEHFYRLFAWQNYSTVGANPLWAKFAYFWGWTLMSWVDVLDRRAALDLYSAFWQWLWCYQIFLFCRALEVERRVGFLQTAAFAVLFGTNLFGIRYYALSSTPLAFIAYFGAISVIIEFSKTRRPLLLGQLPFLILLMGFNHLQELFLFFLSSAALLLYFWTRLFKKRLIPVIALATLAGISIGFGVWAMSVRPELFGHFDRSALTAWGGFKLWGMEDHSPYLETLGLHGLVALGLAAFYFRRFPIVGVLTLAPVLALWLPQTTMLMTPFVKDTHTPYRLLYAMPTSVVLVLCVHHWLKNRRPEVSFLLSSVAIFLLALPSEYPWRGRLKFQVHSPSSQRQLVGLDQTADWLRKNRDYSATCQFLTDDATHFLLATQLGDASKPDRRHPSFLPHKIIHPDQLLLLVNQPSICGVLVANSQKIPQAGKSWVAQSSQHWPEKFADLAWLNSPVFEQTVHTTLHEWNQTQIAPFFTLYEPPSVYFR